MHRSGRNFKLSGRAARWKSGAATKNSCGVVLALRRRLDVSFRRFENSRNVKVLLSEIPSLLAHPCLFAVGSTITNYDRVGFPRLPLSSILLLVPSPSNRPLLKHFRSYRVDPGSFLRL